MANIPNQTTSSDDDITQLYDKLKEDKAKLESAYNELKEACGLAEEQTFDLYVGLTEMKAEISGLIEERNSRQEVRDFIEDHVFKKIDLLWGSKKAPEPPILTTEDLLLKSPSWNTFKKKAEHAISKYPTWREKQPGSVNITNRLKPWLIESNRFNDRETGLLVPILKDKYPSDFPN